MNESGNIEFISNVFKGSIWRYDNDNNNINNGISGSVTFTKSGFNYIELWYIDAIDNTNYLCFDVFVEKK